MQPEAWLRGPLPGIDSLLMPSAHALVQAREDVDRASEGLNVIELWLAPEGAASVGFHLHHIAGSIERLLTYARGETLSDVQHDAIRREGIPGDPPAEARVLIENAQEAIDAALRVLRATPASSLLEKRTVGRAGLPSNVIGLLFHIAEHTQRHTGQIITTAKIVRGLASRNEAS